MTAGVNIFDGLVCDENSMTQLLRNIMVRSPVFRKQFLSTFLSGADASRITSSDIRTQERAGSSGRPDLLIRTGELCALIEVKFTVGRGCTDNQPNGYLDYLQTVDVPKRWLMFLIPKNSSCRGEICRDLKKREAHYRNVINTKIVNWESVLDILNRVESKARDPLMGQYRQLLNSYFGPVVFSGEENRMLISNDFANAYRTMRKLETLIDGMAATAQAARTYGRVIKSSRKDKSEEYGVYFNNGQRDYLFFGFWLDFFEQENLPLCVCIQEKWKDNVPGLGSAFSRKFKGRTIRCKDWDVAGIPPKLLQGENPVEEIWELFLQPLLQELIRPSNERPHAVGRTGGAS